MTTYIVTRHKGAIAWLREHLVSGTVVEQWTGSEVISASDCVIGTLPIPMIAGILEKGARFGLLNLPAIAFSQRGQELTPAEMDEAGANVREINKIELGGLWFQGDKIMPPFIDLEDDGEEGASLDSFDLHDGFEQDPCAAYNDNYDM